MTGKTGGSGEQGEVGGAKANGGEVVVQENGERVPSPLPGVPIHSKSLQMER